MAECEVPQSLPNLDSKLNESGFVDDNELGANTVTSHVLENTEQFTTTCIHEENEHTRTEENEQMVTEQNENSTAMPLINNAKIDSAAHSTEVKNGAIPSESAVADDVENELNIADAERKPEIVEQGNDSTVKEEPKPETVEQEEADFYVKEEPKPETVEQEEADSNVKEEPKPETVEQEVNSNVEEPKLERVEQENSSEHKKEANPGSVEEQACYRVKSKTCDIVANEAEESRRDSEKGDHSCAAENSTSTGEVMVQDEIAAAAVAPNDKVENATATDAAPEELMRTFITEEIDFTKMNSKKQDTETADPLIIGTGLENHREIAPSITENPTNDTTNKETEAIETQKQVEPRMSSTTKQRDTGEVHTTSLAEEEKKTERTSVPSLPPLEELEIQKNDDDDVRPDQKLQQQLTDVRNTLATVRADLMVDESKDDALHDEIRNLNEKLQKSQLEQLEQVKETEALRIVLNEHIKEKKNLQVDLKSFRDKLSRAEKKCSSLQMFLCQAEEVLQRHYKETMSSSNAIFREEINKLTDQMAEMRLAQRRDSDKHDATIQDLMRRIKNLKQENDRRNSIQQPLQQSQGSKTCTII